MHCLYQAWCCFDNRQTNRAQTESRPAPVPVLHVCAQSVGLQHGQLAMVVAHQLPIVVLLLPFGLSAMSLLYQPMLGIPISLVHLLKGRSPQIGVGSAYCSLPVEGRLQGMLGSRCCFLVPLPGLLSNLKEQPGSSHVKLVWCMLPCESRMLGSHLI